MKSYKLPLPIEEFRKKAGKRKVDPLLYRIAGKRLRKPPTEEQLAKFTVTLDQVIKELKEERG